MGAIAISKEEGHRIDRLRKELRITTKAGLIREALKALEMKTREERLRSEIQESVHCCAAADREENRELVLAGVAGRVRSR